MKYLAVVTEKRTQVTDVQLVFIEKDQKPTSQNELNGILIKFLICFQRWQRRWFVLYDDGELTYAVDESVSIFFKNKLLNPAYQVAEIKGLSYEMFSLFSFLQPETIPQAIINMSDVIEVADAEQITGHTYSILIQTPDRSTFVKSNCCEESKWWFNVLVQLVKSKVRHHKRNAFLKGQNQKCKFCCFVCNNF